MNDYKLLSVLIIYQLYFLPGLSPIDGFQKQISCSSNEAYIFVNEAHI